MKAFVLLILPVGIVAWQHAAADPSARKSGPDDVVSLRIIKTTQAVFPVALLNKGVRYGETDLMISVDSEGKLDDALVTGYTRPEFAEEALRVIRQWRYVPTRFSGQRVSTVAGVSCVFEVNGILARVRQPTEPDTNSTLQEEYAKFGFHVGTLRELDRIPAPIHNALPHYPQEWEAKGIRGAVTVDFFIDETGRTRIVTTDPSADRFLAGIAMDAVERWRFEPPLSKGKPVLVRAQQLFVFGQAQPGP